MADVSLSDVVRFTSGGTPPRNKPEFYGGDIPWITAADISQDQRIEARSFITNQAVVGSSASVLPAGTIALVTRTSIGKVGIFDRPMAFSQDITAITPSDHVDVKYLAHFLRSSAPELARHGRGATIKGVTRAVVGSLRMPLPTLDEQRHIAAGLDAADAIRSKREAAIAHLDALTQALFVATFGAPASWPERWPMGTIDDHARSVDYGISAKASAFGDWPMLRMGNITDDGRLDLADLKYLDLSEKDQSKYTLRRGDLLFNRTNSLEKVGKSAVVRTDQPFVFAGYLVRVRFENAAVAEFVAAYLNSAFGRRIRRRLAKAAVNQANINATEMRGIPIALPDEASLAHFALGLDAIEAQRAKFQRAVAADDQLVASLQSRAFSGKL